MTYAIILAGGVGSRFWPLSTQLQPKQFLSFCSDKSLLEESILRIANLIGRRNIYIATNKNYRAKVRDCIRKFRLSAKNFLFEPEAKNTLVPIGALSCAIFNKDKEAIIMVLPSDHLIKKKHKFLEILKTSIEVAKEGYIVTLGILPKRPETGYGYIQIKSKIPALLAGRENQKSKIYTVHRFIEKPDLKIAKKLIRDRGFYWNAGIFIFKAQTLLEEIRELQPKVYKILMQIKDKEDLNRLWSKFPAVSIDYAIMEKTKKIALLPADCGWLDLGNWNSIEQIFKKDKNGNIFKGKHIDLGSRDITVYAKEKKVVTLGLNNLVIVDSKDGLLVCNKNKTQEIKQIVKKI
jgi:mannose-1-phosphate guanylyltransferase